MAELRAVAPSTQAPAFLVTIDTEGDDLWGRPQLITTRNARHVQRFQRLCESFGLRPTWLTNYEMARCPHFLAFGRDVVRRGAGEIGMHLHAWNSPPLEPLGSGSRPGADWGQVRSPAVGPPLTTGSTAWIAASRPRSRRLSSTWGLPFDRIQASS